MLQRFADAFHIMIDIETLGTKPGCYVWQIGVAGASGKELLSVDIEKEDFSTLFYETAKVPVEASSVPGGLVDEDTLNWQLTKNGYNYTQAIGHSYQAPVESDMLWDFLIAMQDLRSHASAFTTYKEILWWSKSVRFDFPILEAALYRHGLTEVNSKGKPQFPWRYWELHEHRTALLLAGRTGNEGRGSFNAHNALEDAHKQLKDLAICVRTLAKESGWNG